MANEISPTLFLLRRSKKAEQKKRSKSVVKTYKNCIFIVIICIYLINFNVVFFLVDSFYIYFKKN
jgi:Na+/melibiose symporter-like transporter